jgi:hypothetical protein
MREIYLGNGTFVPVDPTAGFPQAVLGSGPVIETVCRWVSNLDLGFQRQNP